MPNVVELSRDSGLPTYFANGSGYTAYATPTDLFTISGADGKVVRVFLAQLRVQVTSGALATVNWVKRSTANSGGTSTTPSGAPFDSSDGAHSAIVRLYTAAPAVLGTAVFSSPNQVLTTATTAVPSIYTSAASILTTSHSPVSFTKPITLRGAAESFCANFGGVALPSGFTAWWELAWTEQPI